MRSDFLWIKQQNKKTGGGGGVVIIVIIYDNRAVEPYTSSSRG